MHPSQNPNPLTWRLLLAILVSSSLLLAGSAPAYSQDFFADEEDFLVKADAGWVEIANGVYEKKMPAGDVVRRGFGPEAKEFFLASAKISKQELLELGPGDDMASYLRTLTELDQRIEALSASTTEARAESVEGLESKAVCYGVRVSIAARAFCAFEGTGIGTSGVSFTDFGPCNSANATVSAGGAPGTAQYETGPLTCYVGRSASARCFQFPGQSGCSIQSFASIDFTTCDLFQAVEAFRFCFPIPGPIK